MKKNGGRRNDVQPDTLKKGLEEFRTNGLKSYMHIYIHTYVCVCIYMYVYIHIYIYIYTHICMYLCTMCDTLVTKCLYIMYIYIFTFPFYS